MKIEFKKYIAVVLIHWAFKILPNVEFRKKLASFLIEELPNL